MIATANYIARTYGVRSAMPGFIGRILCPELVIVTPDYRKYSAVAEQFREIVQKYDPDFVSMGLDEVNMDVTDYLIEHGLNNEEGSKELAEKIRREVHRAT